MVAVCVEDCALSGCDFAIWWGVEHDVHVPFTRVIPTPSLHEGATEHVSFHFKLMCSPPNYRHVFAPEPVKTPFSQLLFCADFQKAAFAASDANQGLTRATFANNMESLPDELILDIFNYLLDQELERNRCFIWGLSLVNWRFHRLLNNHLYKAYTFHLGHPELFLRTISSSPELARCVKRVTWGFQSPDPISLCNLLSPAEKHHIARRLRALGGVAANQLANMFPSLTNKPGSDTNEDESYLGAFLLFTPNIEVLEVTKNESWNSQGDWLIPVAEHGHMFANLVEVKLTGRLRIKNVLALLTIPSLRILKLVAPSWGTGPNMLSYTEADREANSIMLQRLQEQGPFVEHLHMAYVKADIADIMPLLGVLRRLKTFDFEKDGGVDNISQVELLRTVKQYSWLEALRFRYWRNIQPPGVLEALGDISHLQSLDIDACQIAPPRALDDSAAMMSFLRCLPSNLKRLALKANNSETGEGTPSPIFAEVLLRLSRTIRTVLPNLTQLSIVGCDPIWGIFPCQTQLKNLQTCFAEAGVEFTSRPSDFAYSPYELHALDYVEQGWVWVQLMDTTKDHFSVKWLQNRFGEPVDECEIDGADLEDEDDWILILTYDAVGEACSASDMVMDQYNAEQPVWYWEELRKGSV